MSELTDAPAPTEAKAATRQLQGSHIWYELMTPDPDGATAFYGAVVPGWTVGQPIGGDQDYRIIGRSDGGSAGGVLALTEDMRQHGARPVWLGYIGADDVDATARQVIDALVPSGELKEKAPDHPVVSAVKRVLRPGGTADRITVSGADDLMVVRARCCNPIRGERIVGYITRGKGVSVHSASCSNVVNLLYDPERRIDVEWDSGGDAAPYTVRLTMQVEDRKGMLAQLSASIADINTNILSLEATTGADTHARIDMTVEIKDVKHLEKVIKSIKGVQGVLGVERTARA